MHSLGFRLGTSSISVMKTPLHQNASSPSRFDLQMFEDSGRSQRDFQVKSSKVKFIPKITVKRFSRFDFNHVEYENSRGLHLCGVCAFKTSPEACHLRTFLCSHQVCAPWAKSATALCPLATTMQISCQGEFNHQSPNHCEVQARCRGKGEARTTRPCSTRSTETD